MFLSLTIAGWVIYHHRFWVANFFSGNIPDYGRSTVLLEKADRFIRQRQLDSAGYYLDLIIDQRKDPALDSRLLDTAQALRWQIKQINLLDTGNIYVGILLRMADQEYEDFLNEKYTKRYLGHPDLNNLFLNKLYSKNQNRQQSSTGLEYPAAGSSKISAAESIAMRKELAETIKNSFVNLGFEITVGISGTENTHLILYAPEFNDEWFEKFENDSAMSEWHQFGFTQVEIRGDSGYVKVKTW
jgi:hypothetical protein